MKNKKALKAYETPKLFVHGEINKMTLAYSHGNQEEGATQGHMRQPP